MKEARRQIDLAVRDGDQVGRNVGRDVLGFRLDDGDGRQGAAAVLLFEVGGSLQQTRVDVEDVPREGLSSGRPAQQKRQLPVGPGVIGQVVVDDQDIPPLGHEILPHGRGGIGCDKLQAGGIRAGGDHQNRVLHGPVCLEVRNDFGHVGGLFADRAIDADLVLAALVDDGIESDCRFSRQTVANDQLPLTPSDRDQRVDHLDPRLKRDGDRIARHDPGGFPLHGEPDVRADFPRVIQRVPDGVYHSADQVLPDRRSEDLPGPSYLGPRLQMFSRSQQDDPDLIRINIEHQALKVFRKQDNLLRLDVGQAADTGNAVTDILHDADLAGFELRTLSRKDGIHRPERVLKKRPDLFSLRYGLHSPPRPLVLWPPLSVP